jgi:UDP-GlcNAc3NAcA epimerase
LIEPLGYFDMLVLEENADCILTDSGGIQKEAYLLGIRCITLREETEWVETVEAGWNRLVGVDSQSIQDTFVNWLPKTNRTSLYGNGDAALRIVQVLEQI